MVSNAVTHGPPGQLEVIVRLSDHTIRVEVADEGIQPFNWSGDQNHDRGNGRNGGWGLHLVEAFSDRCGVEWRPFTVAWCELDLH
jgi:anti-sigma regulatory factor (Ser/Thr protein kinase)